MSNKSYNITSEELKEIVEDCFKKCTEERKDKHFKLWFQEGSEAHKMFMTALKEEAQNWRIKNEENE